MQAPDVKLKNYDKFKKILADYKLSDRAIKALEGLRLVLMVAPSSTGRNTVIKHLVSTRGYYFIVSDTTRPPQVRDGELEQDGVQYFFRQEEDMLYDLRRGEYLEAEILHGQQVSGMSIRELEKAKNLDKIAITDIDIGGIESVIKVKPDTTAIMLLPPSFEEWQTRFTSRGKMPRDEYIRRAKTVPRILRAGINNDYFQFVIAEDVERSAEIIDFIANGGISPHQERGKKLVGELQAKIAEVIHRVNA